MPLSVGNFKYILLILVSVAVSIQSLPATPPPFVSPETTSAPAISKFPIVQGQDLNENPLVEGQDLIENPLVEGQDLIDNPLVIGQDLMENPLVIGQDLIDKAPIQPPVEKPVNVVGDIAAAEESDRPAIGMPRFPNHGRPPFRPGSGHLRQHAPGVFSPIKLDPRKPPREQLNIPSQHIPSQHFTTSSPPVHAAPIPPPPVSAAPVPPPPVTAAPIPRPVSTSV